MRSDQFCHVSSKYFRNVNKMRKQFSINIHGLHSVCMFHTHNERTKTELDKYLYINLVKSKSRASDYNGLVFVLAALWAV